MPMIDYIDARVCVNGAPLHEYVGPEGDNDDTRSRTRYIEAQVGQRFSVVVRLAPNFELQHVPWFYSNFTIDDDGTNYYNYISDQSLDHHRGYLRQAQVIDNRSTSLVFDDAVGQWMNAAFEFGPLGTSKPIPFARHHH
jgi:hypothetical protein